MRHIYMSSSCIKYFKITGYNNKQMLWFDMISYVRQLLTLFFGPFWYSSHRPDWNLGWTGSNPRGISLKTLNHFLEICPYSDFHIRLCTPRVLVWVLTTEEQPLTLCHDFVKGNYATPVKVWTWAGIYVLFLMDGYRAITTRHAQGPPQGPRID